TSGAAAATTGSTLAWGKMVARRMVSDGSGPMVGRAGRHGSPFPSDRDQLCGSLWLGAAPS
ncbi:MAG: hypothetical protein Q8N51_11705, partial [Gammaproteobacteria bacterium]|nr:hypothetical protein [Gammaproteobacteria bacterium]